MKLWEVVQTVREMGGTMEDVRAIMGESGETAMENPVQTGDKADAPVQTEDKADAPVQTVDNSELEALRLENASLKGQLQTYNILHASLSSPSTPSDAAVQVGVDMIK